MGLTPSSLGPKGYSRKVETGKPDAYTQVLGMRRTHQGEVWPKPRPLRHLSLEESIRLRRGQDSPTNRAKVISDHELNCLSGPEASASSSYLKSKTKVTETMGIFLCISRNHAFPRLCADRVLCRIRHRGVFCSLHNDTSHSDMFFTRRLCVSGVKRLFQVSHRNHTGGHTFPIIATENPAPTLSSQHISKKC